MPVSAKRILNIKQINIILIIFSSSGRKLERKSDPDKILLAFCKDEEVDA